MLPKATPREELLTNLRAAYARMWVRLRGSNREITGLVAEIGLPILTIGAYVILYRAIGLPPTAGAAVIIGGAMIAFWTNVLWNMSSQWFWERESGNLEMYLVAPVSRMSVLLGMAMGGSVNTSIRALGIVLLGIFVFQVPFQLADPLSVGLVFVLTLVALYTMGMLFASGLDAIRRLAINGESIATVWPHILALIACTLILFPLARRALNYMESLGKKEGRLTLRWQ